MRLHRTLAVVSLLASGVPTAASAQGFQLNEIGSCEVARGGAVTGMPCKDPSVIYWNPGAAVDLQGWTAYVGAAAIAVQGGFTADTTGRLDGADVPVSWPVHAFVNYGAKDGRWAAGLGVYVPYGLTSQWHGNFAGRFEAQKAALASVYVQPNFAWRFAKNWSVGGGPVFGYSEVQLRQSLDLAQQFAAPGVTFGQLGVAGRTEFARATLEGHATAWGFNVGLHGNITPDWEVGARYLSQLDFKYDNATAQFSQVLTNLELAAANPLGFPGGTPVDSILSYQFFPGGPLTTQGVSTEIKHPAQLQVGLGYSGLVNTRLSADFEWTNFSVFNQLPVEFQGAASGQDVTLLESYENSWSIRAGIEHAFPIGIKGRAGFGFYKSPAPDETVTPLLPDMNRRNYALGFGVPLSPTYTLDAAYLHVDTSGRRGRIVERTDPSQTAADLNSGFYTLSANIFSITIRANF